MRSTKAFSFASKAKSATGSKILSATQISLTPGQIALRGLHRLNKAALLDAGEKALEEFFTQVSEDMKAKHSRPYAPGAQNAGLQRRSGNALSALSRHSMTRSMSSVEGKMTLPFYLKQQEYGGILRAKSGGYIAVPLPAALNADGTPKRRRASDWGSSFVIKSKAGNLLIVQKSRAGLTPLYALKKFVRITPELGMLKSFRRGQPHLTDKLLELINQYSGTM